MARTSEQVHWILGGVLIFATMLFVLRASGRIREFGLIILPWLLAAFGLEMLLTPLRASRCSAGSGDALKEHGR